MKGNYTVIDPTAVTGIRDPEDHDRWLVCPWPVQANFGEIVRHFLNAYLCRLQGDTGAAPQLAYFEGYQAALSAAPTDGLRCTADWKWRDELLACIARCITVHQDMAADACPAPNLPRLQPNAPQAVSLSMRWDQAS